MEQTAKHNIVHISQSTYGLIKGKSSFTFSVANPIDHMGTQINTYDLSFGLGRKQSFHTIEELRGFFLGDGQNMEIHYDARDDDDDNDIGEGSSAGIVKKMVNFNGEISKYTNRFLDLDQEDDFEFDFITHQYSAQTLSCGISLLLFTAVAIFQNLDPHVVFPLYWIHFAFAISLAALTVTIQRLQAQCHAFFLEFGNGNGQRQSKQNLGGKLKGSVGSGSVNMLPDNDAQIYGKVFKWVKPNISAVSAIWIANSGVIICTLLEPRQVDRILPLMVMISLHFGFFGTHSLYLNGSLVVYGLISIGIFIPAILAKELVYNAHLMIGHCFILFTLVIFLILVFSNI
jgi:hypothetical protein